MIKNILSTITLTAFFALAIVAVSTISDQGVHSVYAHSAGSQGQRTNSPGDIAGIPSGTANCTNCHTGSALNSGNASVSITAPGLSSGYVAGSTYTITTTISESGINKFGFEATVEKDSDNSKIGTLVLTDATNTKFTNSNNAVTHTGAGTTPTGTNTTSWSFDWTAPVSGSGSVTFYSAFNSADGSGSGGDKIYTATPLSVSEASVGVNDVVDNSKNTIFPNPANNYFEITSDEQIEKVSIFDLNGKMMVSNAYPNGRINTESLSSGVYLVQVFTANNVSTQKLTIK